MMEIHRQKPECRSCHARMDPIGLGLENFNALGQFRTQENGKPIDTSGKLLTGETFSDVAALKEILAVKRKADFHRCLSEKLLTYAIGRGVEYTMPPPSTSSPSDWKKAMANSANSSTWNRRKRPFPEAPRRQLTFPSLDRLPKVISD